MLSLYALSNLHGSTLGGGSVVGFLARYLCKYWVWLPLFWDAKIHLAIDYLTMQLCICGINFFDLFLIWGNFRVILFVLICLIVLFWTPSDAILQVSLTCSVIIFMSCVPRTISCEPSCAKLILFMYDSFYT